jgi:hypothetical protein
MDAPRTVLLASRQDDFAIYEPEIHRCETDDVPNAIPANDNLRTRTGLSERCRALLRCLIEKRQRSL